MTNSSLSMSVEQSAMADRWFGLLPSLRQALTELNISKPTHIQALSIPPLLRGGSVALGSGTGTGKTLSYALPIVHLIKEAEAKGVGTRGKHPRALVILPTRELERQVLSVFKQLAHCAKVRVLGISGGSKQGVQRIALDSAVDIIVATPGRLSLLLEQRRLSLADVRHVVIDEVDTMMGDSQFAEELRAVLGPLRTANSAGKDQPEVRVSQLDVNGARPKRGFGAVQVILAGATIPRRARTLVESAFPDITFVTSGSLHLAPERVTQRFERVAGDPEAKHNTLFALIEELRETGVIANAVTSASRAQAHNATQQVDLVPANTSSTQSPRLRRESLKRSGRLMIFCNTIPSARSTAHALAEAGLSLACLHGGIPPQLREREYAAFRDGLVPVLVCTDAAARGLDLPSVSHVVNFDFPLSPIDYLHRVGRTGRAGAAGVAISFVQKHDAVLAIAIERAVARRMPLDALSSHVGAYVHPKVLAGNARRREGIARVERLRGDPTSNAKHAVVKLGGRGVRSFAGSTRRSSQ